MSDTDAPDELTTTVDYTPPNEQQTSEPAVSAAVSSAVASGLGNLPSNPDEEQQTEEPVLTHEGVVAPPGVPAVELEFDPADYNADEIVNEVRAGDYTPDELHALRDEEEAGKNRKSVLDAIDHALAAPEEA
jgi:hypothetical protein